MGKKKSNWGTIHHKNVPRSTQSVLLIKSFSFFYHMRSAIGLAILIIVVKILLPDIFNALTELTLTIINQVASLINSI